MQPHRHLVTRPPRALPLLLAALLAAGCSGTPADDEQPAALPSAAIFAPLGEPLRSLDDAALARFEAGRRAMSRRFSAAEGLGPRFNATSCAACHERPVVGGSASRYRNVFVLAGAADAIVRVQQQFAVGARGRADDIAAGGGGGGGGGDGARTVTRNPMPLFGLGLIAELPVDVITENADPLDADGDGISGRVNFERGFVGRFGRKAQMASLSGVIRLALRDHLGLTSGGIGAHVDPQPSPVNLPTADDDGVADPEVSSAHVEALIAFVSGLAAPPPDAPTPASERGRALFARVGCTGCHKPALVGPRGALPLYSDLLLHDMGDALGDGVQVGVAEAREFRTQPLWGLSATGPYLHDGRADTIAGAILLHGGEAARAREAYVALAPDERADVLSFLRSLGGASSTSAGLLPPAALAPPAGAAGGPARPLDAAEQRRFERGRAVFDGDFGIADGLGPRFNGDACRSCHFDPVLGGAGPSGVDVVRQAMRDEDGRLVAPPGGTMAHRFDVSGRRPALDGRSSVVELRNTPTTLGLGLIDRIPEATILALADPDDRDGDGIRGRAHRLADGRLGRFGWKANVPSLEEFARDALSGELGITVPARAGLTFGKQRDDDGVSDPEIKDADYDALVFFMKSLAPPPRKPIDSAHAAAGAALFARIGCQRCHVPELRTADGTPVPLYSDLLLHDVMAVGTLGVPSGAASGRELRTPPLWGLSGSAPYMHDGRAATIEQAIERHDGEGRAARTAFRELDSAARATLLEFLGSL